MIREGCVRQTGGGEMENIALITHSQHFLSFYPAQTLYWTVQLFLAQKMQPLLK